MKNNFKYFAFISYSRKNEKEAIWLQKKLESYRLPAVLQKQYEGLPKKLHIFRDKTDICAGDTVENALSRELQDSKNLIVLCSPDSAKSEYVNYEIQSFLSLGRSTENIFPLIIAGSPSAESEQCCFSPQLKNLNLNAADVIADGKKNAFVRLLASLLGIKYDDLKRREHIRTVRRNAVSISAATVFAVFLCALIWYITPHTRYYGDYITRWGIPEGIEETRLTKKEIKSLFEHYEITYQYGRPIKLVHANSAGTPIPEYSVLERQNRPIEAIYTYKNSFLPSKNLILQSAEYSIYSNDITSFVRDYKIRLDYQNSTKSSANIIFYYDTKENPLQKQLSNNVLSDSSIYYFDIPALSASNSVSKLVNFAPELVFFEDYSSIYQHKVSYDEKTGFEKKIIFYNKNNRVAADKNKVIGYEFEYDVLGRKIAENYLYSDYSLGYIARKELSYTGNRLTSVSYYDIEQNSVYNSTRCFSSKKIEWDKVGNYSSVKFFDEVGKASIHKKYFGATELFFEYDENGFEVKNIFSNGTVRSANYKHDRQGNPCEIFQHFANGDKIHIKNVFEKNLKLKDCVYYDSLGNEDYRESYSRAGNTIVTDIAFNGNQFQIIDVFDEYGRHIKEIEKYEKATFSCEIDYKGDNRSICYFYNGKYYEPDEKGYARADFAYNNDGMLVSASFKDSAGKNIVCNLYDFGFAIYRATYSPNNHLLNAEFLDETEWFSKKTRYRYSSYWAETDLNDNFICKARYDYGEIDKAIDYTETDSETVVSYYLNQKIEKKKYYSLDGNLTKTLFYLYDSNDDFEIFTMDSTGHFMQSDEN